MTPIARRFAGVLVAAALQGACYETQYVDTVVHRDGSADRAFVQAADFTPDAARRAGNWQQFRLVKPEVVAPWDGTIAGLPASGPKDEKPYIAARGHFGTVKEIPDHYVEMAADGVSASRLTRTYEDRNLGLVTERVWTETLNDILNPTEMALARTELAGINRKLLTGALEEGLGSDYAYADYVRWVEEVEKNLFASFADAAVEARAAGRKAEFDPPKELSGAFEKRYGLPLGDDFDKRMRSLLEQKTRELIVKRDGGRLSDDQVNVVISGIWEVGEHALVRFQNEGASAKFAAGAARVAKAEFGGDAALEKKASVLYQRSLGITFTDSGRKYAFSLTLPGTIVETNGMLASDSRARWDFELGDAFAFGYTMRCRTLEANADAQKSVGAAIDTREAMLRYVSLVGEDADLRAAVVESVRARGRGPLTAYRARLSGDKTKEQAAKVDRLLALLSGAK
jgi:hypothetical protein